MEKDTLLYDLDAEHVDGSPDDMCKVVVTAVPSADEPAEFFALEDTESDITTAEEALDKLLRHEVVEHVPPGPKHTTTRWARQWRRHPADKRWKRKVRCVCREDLCCHESMPATNRLIDFLELEINCGRCDARIQS